jgi:protein-tyrosine phosphatase
VLYHCTAGKDRTSWMTAIVLTALGVHRADVMDDYLLSNLFLRVSNEKLLADLAKAGMMRDPGLLRPLLEQRPAYLEAAFDEAGRRFGSFGDFLAEGLGADDAMLQALRDDLLE